MSCKLDKWTIPQTEISFELERGTIPSEMICLGCAAKVNLVDTVYPALDIVRSRTSNLKYVNFQKREDSYYFLADKKDFTFRRIIHPLNELLNPKLPAITQALKNNGPGGAILLFNFTPQPKIEYFADLLTNLLVNLEDAQTPITVGKGHTIQLARIPEETCMMADFIGHSGGDRYWGLVNNDTISNVDPMLPHSHKFAVAIALNNTLNDLFVYGITGGFILYPSYDARDEAEIQSIRDAMKWYEEKFAGIGLEIRDQGPMKTNNKLIGATATGFSDRQIPLNTGLVPGQVIIATRPIGDLAPLNEYLIRVSIGDDVEDIEKLRHHVIHTMLIPNVEAAMIIRDYLPPIGSEVNPERHITATRDMSGPGLLALEEIAEDSLCDINLDRIVWHDERIANIEVTNVTAGTNGAILIAAMKGIGDEIIARLKEAGYDPWIVGTVGERNERPVITIDRSLAKYDFLTRGKGFFRNSQFV